MNKLFYILVGVLLLSGCALAQNQSTGSDLDSLHVSGDATISAIDRKGF